MVAGHSHTKKQVFNSRRRTRRVEIPSGIWAFWRCGRAEDTSRVRDLSATGLFLETAKVCPVDSTVELHFLVEEGDVRANAAIRHVTQGRGLGLQFKSVRGEDQTRFSTMVKRLILPAERAF
jgi:hypothetical protein